MIIIVIETNARNGLTSIWESSLVAKYFSIIGIKFRRQILLIQYFSTSLSSITEGFHYLSSKEGCQKLNKDWKKWGIGLSRLSGVTNIEEIIEEEKTILIRGPLLQKLHFAHFIEIHLRHILFST